MQYFIFFWHLIFIHILFLCNVVLSRSKIYLFSCIKFISLHGSTGWKQPLVQMAYNTVNNRNARAQAYANFAHNVYNYIRNTFYPGGGGGVLGPHFGRHVPRLEREIGGLRSWSLGRVWLAFWPAVTHAGALAEHFGPQ